MIDLAPLLHGFAAVLTPYHLALMVGGVLLGILVGVLPGLGAPNGVTLLMPLTFSMEPISGIIVLSSMYWGARFGGSTTSILFNSPGEPSSVATTFDGYPLAKQGRAAEALSTAFMICCIRISWSARFEEFGRLKNAPVGGVYDNGGAGALACAGGAMTTPSARTASATTTRTSFFMRS